MKRFLFVLIAAGWTANLWACPTCGVDSGFTPKTLALSLSFALLPTSLMFFLGWRIFREELLRNARRDIHRRTSVEKTSTHKKITD